MTAEVAILNKQAVALAADSAVTVGFPDGPKIFNTLKLFTLSKRRPVGIMIYSSAEIMEAPVETAIKVFRNQIDGEGGRFATLDDYYHRFQSFLKDEQNLFTYEDRLAQCCSVIEQNMAGLRRSIGMRLARQYPGLLSPTQTVIKRTARQMIEEHHRLYATSNLLDGQHRLSGFG